MVDSRARLLAVAALALVGPHFLTATAFVGDDHVFLAFARFEANPLSAFVSDKHGGEYWRPLPMLLWWLLGRAGGGAAWPFAVAGLGLHAGCAALTARLAEALGRSRREAWLAAAFFFLAASTREAAYWFAASTDLLCTAFTLATLLALLRRRAAWSLLLTALACLCKETAAALPLLAVVILRFAPPRRSWRAASRAVVPLVAVFAAYATARALVLGGWGGPGDEKAGLPGRMVQIASTLVHAVTASDLLPEWLAVGCGFAVLVLATRAALHARTDGDAAALVPLAWIGVSVVPLLAAGWVVGARYVYLPAVGLAWLVAAPVARAQAAARGVLLALVALLGAAGGEVRRAEIASYGARVAAARRAVLDGARHGHRVFHVDGGIKDLDLAVKEAPDVAALSPAPLILGDVPASFVEIPADLADASALLVAQPPLPPSGAYVFGAHRIVGLARRGDDPGLDEVLVRFPGIRFVRLRVASGGHVVARDLTDEVAGTVRAAD